MKKHITVIMLCMAAAFISACSSGKVADSKNLNAYERTLYIPTKEYPDTSVDTMVSFDEKCFYAECRFEDIDGKQKYVLKNIYEYNYATGEAGKLDLLTDVEEYCGYCLTPDNNWLVYDPVNWDVSLRDAGHKVVAETNLQETSFPKTDAEKSRLNTISDVRCDENYVYICGKNKQNKATMLVFDMDLKEKNAFFADREWIFIPMQNNRIGLIDNKKGHIYTYNEEKNALEDVGKIPKNVLNASSTKGFCRGNAEYDYFYYTNGYGNEETGVSEDFLIGVKGEKQEKIWSFTAMGIENLYVQNITPDAQDGFWVWVIKNDEGTVLYHFTPSDRVQDYSLKADKTCCKIGALLGNDVYLKYCIEDFNRQSEDYYFETVSYMDLYEDREIAITHLFLDCQNGVLDGIILDDIEEELVKNDALYDLKDYFAQSKAVSKDSFITHYLESVTDEEGRIYALYTLFHASAYAYGEQIDFSNLMQYQSLCEEDKSFLAGYETTLDLSRLLYFSGDRFLNEKTGEIHVKEEAFRSMLQFLKIQSACRYKNNNELLQYLDGEAYVPYVTIAEPIQYLHYNNWFHGNAVFTNVGTEGLVIGSRDGLLGVCTKSQHKEALYAFYDFLFEPSYYHTIAFSSNGLSVIKEEYELWKEYFLATEDYEDKYGEFHRKYDLEFGIGSSVIKVGSVSEQEAEEVITALQEAKYIKPMKDAYENIITEEASAYFAGTQDLDRTCDNIENRLQLALEENKQ